MTVTERELLSQPDAWRSLGLRLEHAQVELPLRLNEFDEVIICGSGSSYYLAIALASAVERMVGVRAIATPSCEVLLTPERYLTGKRRRAAITVSRSGESSEAVLAQETFKRDGVVTLAVSCDPNSSLAEKSDHHIDVSEGREDGLVMLRSFTSMLIAFQVLVARQAGVDGPVIDKLAATADDVLARRRAPLAELAAAGKFRRHVFLGSGATYPITSEAALKMQEMAAATTEAYHSLEYRHGPKATAGDDTLVTLFALDDDDHYGPDLLRHLKEYGVTALVIGERPDAFEGIADMVVRLESGLAVHDRLPLYLLPCQLLALETTLAHGKDPDVPRNLTSVVQL